METADSSRPGQRPRPRIQSLTDLVFGLALSIGAISLISNKPADARDLYLAIVGLGFSFLILIQIWFRFTEIMSLLPVETSGTRVLNTLLLFLVALEPYLFNNLGSFFVTGQQSGPLDEVASTLYALDIGAIYAILAMFTHILATEEKKLVAPDLLRKYRFSRNLEIIVAIIFLSSATPEFWTLNLRYFIWATTFFVFRGGSILRGLRKRPYPPSRRHVLDIDLSSFTGNCNYSKCQQVTAPIQRRRTWPGLPLSKQPRAANTKMTSFTGVFLLIFSVLYLVPHNVDRNNACNGGRHGGI